MNHQDIIQFNCNGFKGAIHELRELVKKYSPKFILLQELKMKHSDKTKLKGYKLIFKNIDNNSHSLPSVGILIKDGIIYDEINIPDNICAIGINTSCNIPVSLFSYYDNHRINKLTERQLNMISELGRYKAIIMGSSIPRLLNSTDVFLNSIRILF